MTKETAFARAAQCDTRAAEYAFEAAAARTVRAFADVTRLERAAAFARRNARAFRALANGSALPA